MVKHKKLEAFYKRIVPEEDANYIASRWRMIFLLTIWCFIFKKK